MKARRYAPVARTLSEADAQVVGEALEDARKRYGEGFTVKRAHLLASYVRYE